MNLAIWDPTLCGILLFWHPFHRPHLNEINTLQATTEWCLYNVVNFIPNPRNRLLIACLWGWGMGCLLWFLYLIHFLPLLSQCLMQHHDKLHCIIMAIHCMFYILCTRSYLIHSLTLLWTKLVNVLISLYIQNISHLWVILFFQQLCCKKAIS